MLNNPVAVGSKVTHGNYTGNDGVNRAIPHGLDVVPDIVLIAREDGSYFHRQHNGRNYIIWMNNAGEGEHAVTAMSAVNFYVGNAAQYNESANANLQDFRWCAIGNN